MENEFYVSQNPTEIVDYSCRYFGSSYSGRFEGTKSLLGFNYKLPIIIEESKSIIFFPTMSPRLEQCNWICLNNITDYNKDNYGTKIRFKNNSEVNIEISYNSLENQIFRATRLESILRKRKNN